MGVAFGIASRNSFSVISLALWLLQSSCPIFVSIPSEFGTEIVM